jgi:hypothetical protein
LAASDRYFLDIERQRYELQLHIPAVLSRIAWSGKQVLEIGRIPSNSRAYDDTIRKETIVPFAIIARKKA